MENTLLVLNSPLPNNSLIFNLDSNIVMELKANGDIYIRGILIENDIEIVNGMREFLKLSK